MNKELIKQILVDQRNNVFVILYYFEIKDSILRGNLHSLNGRTNHIIIFTLYISMAQIHSYQIDKLKTNFNFMRPCADTF